MNACYCGHDCARCVVYLATVRGDPALRLQAQTFYRETFHQTLPLSDIRCLGGRSDEVFALCADCPFAACCRSRGLDACTDCPDFPCETLAAYRERWVNRCLQID